jgi:hypothetical protein
MMDKSMQSSDVADQDQNLPVCDLKHRVKIPAGAIPGPYKYKCCDARECHWKKHTDDWAFCLFDQAHR